MVTDRARRELFAALEQQLGRAPADTLMELLPPVGWADVARRADLVGVRGEIAGLAVELRGEMTELRHELRTEMEELRHELRGEMEELRHELRGEMEELRHEVRGLLPKLLAAQLGTTFAFGSLLVAAVALV